MPQHNRTLVGLITSAADGARCGRKKISNTRLLIDVLDRYQDTSAQVATPLFCTCIALKTTYTMLAVKRDSA